MAKFASSLLVLLVLGTSAGYSQSDPSLPEQKIRTFINLLDYIGKDYPNAVRGGEAINEFEYNEMLDFSRQVGNLHRQLGNEIDRPELAGMAGDILKLQGLIDEKAGSEDIAILTSQIRRQILELELVKVTPQRWPNLADGRQIFEQRCQSCHGADGFGDGPLAEQLNPPPTNFQDSANANKLSPLQAYNTIRLGLEGTGMRAFAELSDQQVWDVAFYINSLDYDNTVPDSVRENVKTALADTASLRSVSLHTNEQWKAFFRQKNIDPGQGMAVIRGLTSDPSSDPSGNSLARALALLENSRQAYASGNLSQALTYAINSYLDGVEPVESQIRASNPALVQKMETEMLAVRSAIQNRVEEPQLDERIRSASLVIEEARNLLDNQTYTFWVNFLLASSILLREGLEAFLIIMVILSVLRSVGASRTTRYVHGGWIAALFVGIGGWFVVQSLVEFSSLQRELMEAIGAGIAVVMLLYIGFWMHSKTQTTQWTRFIKEKVNKLLDKENLWGLALLSFIVVFREAFESIIFLSSISLKSAGSNVGIFSALISVALIIACIGYAFNRVTRKIPVRQLFRYSSFMLAALSVILIGKGVRSLQEAGYLDIASLPVQWNIPTLGLYSTWPTILAQLTVLAIIGGLWYYSNYLAVRRQMETG